jgi:class 3 adenylate cyclase/predicted ATPase
MMLCHKCQANNWQDAACCMRCGAELLQYCPACHKQCRPQAKFCDECGTPLAAKADATEELGKNEGQLELRISERIAPDAQRRRLTVMFCDLVESTVLSERLDPEELREVMDAYQKRATNVVAQFGGHVAKYLGDGLLAYFGYPQARGDDVRRAVRAGLEIVAAMPQLNAELRHIELIGQLPLRVRIGIHTGLAVVGDMGVGPYRDPMAAVGETPNVAARIQGFTSPDSVVVSAATQKLIETHFVCESLGLQILKGISAPMELHRVLREKTDESRIYGSGAANARPMVGRYNELGQLLEQWEQAKRGQSKIVLISGEAGIGKTRLMRELRAHVAREGYTHIEIRCLPHYQNTALYPAIEHVQRLLQFDCEDTPQQKLVKLEHKLKLYGLTPHEGVPLLASLLSLPHPEDYPPLDLSPAMRKQKTLQALIGLVVAEAERNPVLAVWEDVHWADPSTLELLDLFAQLTPAARILVLLIFRPDLKLSWDSRPHVTTLMINRLPGAEVRALVERLAEDDITTPEIIDQIVSTADGVPLFAEELTRMLLESDRLKQQDDRYASASIRPGLGIPITLQDLLTARLDQVPTARPVAQLAAILGREFRYDFLKVVSPWTEATLWRELSRLVETELLYQRGVLPHATYVFKHALIQEAAYQSLLKRTRKEYHARVANALEEHFPEVSETRPELIAHHLTAADLNQRAASYWYRAAQRAIERSANLEAIAQLRNGLNALRATPEGPERIQQELAMQSLLGMALIFAKGYSEREVEQAYARARELCRQLGETHLLYPVLWGQWAYYLVRGNYEVSHDISRQLLAAAERQNDTDLLLEAHVTQGLSSFYGGSGLAAAHAHFKHADSLYDLQQHHAHALTYGQDPGVVSLAALSWVLWLQGYPEQGLAAHRKCLEMAKARSHQHSLAYALAYGATFRQFRRDLEAARNLAERGIALSTEHGFPIWAMAASYTLGWTLAHAGEAGKAVTCLRDAIQAWRAIGAQVTRPHQLGLLADALAGTERPNEGLEVLKGAILEAQQTTERYYEPELYRLTGELLLQSAVPDEEQACAAFNQSLECARELGAKSWELRTAMSLARLRLKQGAREQARRTLAKVYEWFIEGFDTPDLRDAKVLLAQSA